MSRPYPMRIDRFEYASYGDLAFTFCEADIDGLTGRRRCSFEIDADDLFNLLNGWAATGHRPVYPRYYYDREELASAATHLEKTNGVTAAVAAAVRAFVETAPAEPLYGGIDLMAVSPAMRQILEPFCEFVDALHLPKDRV